MVRRRLSDRRLGDGAIVIPGYLVIAVVIYCAHHQRQHDVHRAQLRADRGAKNQSEAEFRYALTRLRENGESIAILGGEKEERDGLRDSLAR